MPACRSVRRWRAALLTRASRCRVLMSSSVTFPRTRSARSAQEPARASCRRWVDALCVLCVGNCVCARVLRVPVFARLMHPPSLVCALPEQTLMYPGDTVRRRMQANGLEGMPRTCEHPPACPPACLSPCFSTPFTWHRCCGVADKNSIDCFRKIVQGEGALGTSFGSCRGHTSAQLCVALLLHTQRSSRDAEPTCCAPFRARRFSFGALRRLRGCWVWSRFQGDKPCIALVL